MIRILISWEVRIDFKWQLWLIMFIKWLDDLNYIYVYFDNAPLISCRGGGWNWIIQILRQWQIQSTILGRGLSNFWNCRKFFLLLLPKIFQNFPFWDGDSKIFEIFEFLFCSCSHNFFKICHFGEGIQECFIDLFFVLSRMKIQSKMWFFESIFFPLFRSTTFFKAACVWVQF